MAADVADPEDVWSIPTHQAATYYGTLFTMPRRARPEKPGRQLSVAWDVRFPLVDGFDNRYTYVVQFGPSGSRAGNHFHQAKSELFFALRGGVRVTLTGQTDPHRERIELHADRWRALLVPPGVAHVVEATSDDASLLVVASSAGTRSDEYPFPVT